MLLLWLKLGVGILAVAAYAGGLQRWVFGGKLWLGLAAVLGLYPLLILVTRDTPWTFLRAAPVLGVIFFFLRYRGAALRDIRLLWFTTLSVLVTHVYYMTVGVY